MKFGGMKFKLNFKGKLSIIINKGPNKGKSTFRKIFNMTTLKFVNGVILISLKVQQYLVELNLKIHWQTNSKG